MHTRLHLLFTLFAIVLLHTTVLAQEIDKLAIRNEMWPSNDPYANAKEVNSEYSDASAVIIFQRYSNTYKKQKNNIFHSSSIRRRIKIQDKLSLEEYSEFTFEDLALDKESFNKKSDFVVGEIKVIKTDGIQFMIDLNEAVDDGDGGFKVAIKNLEIGDIVDYYYYSYESSYHPKGKVFNPVITTLGDGYPIMKQVFEYTAHKNFYISMNTYNGAPIVRTTENENTITYIIEDENRAAVDYPVWYLPYREQPIMKFQVVQCDNPKYMDKLYTFAKAEDNTLISSVNGQDVAKLASNMIKISKTTPSLMSAQTAAIYKASSPRDKVALIYNSYRYHSSVKTYEAFHYHTSNVYHYGFQNLLNIEHDLDFIQVMGSALETYGFDYDVVATIDRNYGNLDNLLVPAELTWVIRVNLDEPVYLSEFDINNQADEIPYSIQGQDAYVLSTSDGKNFSASSQITLPKSNHEKNKSNGATTITWSADDIQKININRTSTFFGHNKNFDRSRIFTIYDLTREDDKHMDVKSFSDRQGLKKKRKTAFEEALAGNMFEVYAQQQEDMQVVTADEYEFEITDYKNAQVLNTGRWNGPFEYSDEFSTDALISQAGKNYIFQVGHLLGSQMEISDEDRTRTSNIYMAFARTFNEEVVIEIPEGYQVQGIDRLNVRVENETGGFVAEAHISDNKLYFSAKKYYTEAHLTADQWPLVLEFLDAAYDLSQEKVLLKKSPSTVSVDAGSH